MKKTEEVAGWGPSRCQGVLAYNSSFWNFLRLQVLVCGFGMGENVGMKFNTMCQHLWTQGVQVAGQTLFLGVSVRLAFD